MIRNRSVLLASVLCLAACQAQESATVLLIAHGDLLVPGPKPVAAPVGALVVDPETLAWDRNPNGSQARLLRVDPQSGRTTVLLRAAEGVLFPRHYHPVTERFWMYGGALRSPDETIGSPSATFWEARPGTPMGPFTTVGTTDFLAITDGDFETILLDGGKVPPNPEAKGRPVDPAQVPEVDGATVMAEAGGSGVRALGADRMGGGGVYLLRLPVGLALPTHSLAAAFEAIVLSGTVSYNDFGGLRQLRPGHFLHVPANLPHNLTAESGAVGAQ